MADLVLRPGPFEGLGDGRDRLWAALSFSPFLWAYPANLWPCLLALGVAFALFALSPSKTPGLGWLYGTALALPLVGTQGGFLAYGLAGAAAFFASSAGPFKLRPFVPAALAALLARVLEDRLGL